MAIKRIRLRKRDLPKNRDRGKQRELGPSRIWLWMPGTHVVTGVLGLLVLLIVAVRIPVPSADDVRPSVATYVLFKLGLIACSVVWGGLLYWLSPRESTYTDNVTMLAKGLVMTYAAMVGLAFFGMVIDAPGLMQFAYGICIIGEVGFTVLAQGAAGSAFALLSLITLAKERRRLAEDNALREDGEFPYQRIDAIDDAGDDARIEAFAAHAKSVATRRQEIVASGSALPHWMCVPAIAAFPPLFLGALADGGHEANTVCVLFPFCGVTLLLMATWGAWLRDNARELLTTRPLKIISALSAWLNTVVVAVVYILMRDKLDQWLGIGAILFAAQIIIVGAWALPITRRALTRAPSHKWDE